MAKDTKKQSPSFETASGSKEAPKQRKTRRFKKSYLAILLLVLLIGVGGFFAYQVYDKQRREISRLSNPQESAKAESERIKDEVSSLIVLPADEEPTIATVVDSSKLDNQPFFANAQNGDRVVMYAKAKKAILYRPSIKKLVEVAPINIGEDKAASKSSSGTTAPKPGSLNEPGISTSR